MTRLNCFSFRKFKKKSTKLFVVHSSKIFDKILKTIQKNPLKFLDNYISFLKPYAMKLIETVC